MSKNKNFFKPVRPEEVDTKILRKTMEADLQRFLDQGGVIEVLGPGERGRPMIESRRTLNAAQIAQWIAKKRALKRDAEEE